MFSKSRDSSGSLHYNWHEKCQVLLRLRITGKAVYDRRKDLLGPFEDQGHGWHGSNVRWYSSLHSACMWVTWKQKTWAMSGFNEVTMIHAGYISQPLHALHSSWMRSAPLDWKPWISEVFFGSLTLGKKKQDALNCMFARPPFLNNVCQRIQLFNYCPFNEVQHAFELKVCCLLWTPSSLSRDVAWRESFSRPAHAN